MTTNAASRSRATDPATSKAAAERVGKSLTAVQARILNMFRLYGDMTDERLLMVLNDAERQANLRPTSPSGCRSRRSELSRPNKKRLAELREAAGYVEGEGWNRLDGGDGLCSDEEVAAYEKSVRATLRAEGFRSPLWDTGKRERNANNYEVVVWGLPK